MNAHHYRVTVERLDGPGGPVTAGTTPLCVEVSNHDDLGDIVARAHGRGDLPANDATAFAIGLKLFSEVMLTHRDLPLFQAFRPHFRAFMQTLKQGPAAGRPTPPPP